MIDVYSQIQYMPIRKVWRRLKLTSGRFLLSGPWRAAQSKAASAFFIVCEPRANSFDLLLMRVDVFFFFFHHFQRLLLSDTIQHAGLI